MMTLANCRLGFLAWLTVCGFVLGDDPVQLDDSKPIPESASVEGERTAVIDMAHVFKNYARFVDKREALKKDIKKFDVTAKLMAQEIQDLDDALEKAKKGTTESTDLQAELARRKVEFEIFRSQIKKDFLKREASLYKDVYLEVKKAVAIHADKNGYAFVIRFNRDDVQDTNEPEEILKAMNRQFVYFRPERDITDEVLKTLNDAYQKDSAEKTKADEK